MTSSDSDLLERLKKGEEIAFKVIFNKFYSKLFYFVREFIPFDDIIEDIIQDTFITLWNKRNELKKNSNLNAYLFTVVKNNCLNKLRDQRYRQRLFAENYADSNELDINENVLASVDPSEYTFEEIEQIIVRTLEELPPQCKKVFILSRFEELKNKQIAEELNISEKMVEKHISKGLKKFREALKDYLPLMAYLLVP